MKTAHNRFNRLYAKKDLTEEIGNFLEKLKGYFRFNTKNHMDKMKIFPVRITYLRDSTKITFPRKIKKIFVTIIIEQ